MNKIATLIIFIIICSCATNKPQINKPCFSFKIPQGMHDNKKEAHKYKYDNFIIENDKNFEDSNILIAIRHADIDKNKDLKSFVEADQYWLNYQVKIYYEKQWLPAGFEEKKINYIAYQFYYKQQGETIYQRSVYIKCGDTVYIISMSSKNRNLLIAESNDAFWNNITAE
jgi:hypothetical protein